MNTKKCISDADLARLWEGDLSPQDKQALQRHIEECSDCRTRWEHMSAGARHVEELIFETARKARTAGECLSDDLLTGFVNETLEPGVRSKVEDHLAGCSGCLDVLAEKFTDAYAKEGSTWWSEYVAHELLVLFALLPERQLCDLLEALNVTRTSTEGSAVIIKLPMLEPSGSEGRRLAAATGEGFSVQTLRQEEPAFEFELVQFGEQVRITARSLGEDPPYANCLARLEIFEQDLCQWSQVMLIEKGEGQCVLEPEQARRIRPEQTNLTMKLLPIVTLEQLTSAGSDAYIPILSKLLKHKEPGIRSATVKVVARIRGPQGYSLIEPLVDDEDEIVRQAVRKALKQFPQI